MEQGNRTVEQSAAMEAARSRRVTELISDILKGALIGIAFIIPGFSGGSVAAILGIYEKLVGAIADIFKHFKKSIITLLPIALGLFVGIAALIFPIQWGMAFFPLPTVSLFVGLAIGGFPPLKQAAGKATPKRIFLFFIALVIASSLVFVPTAVKTEGFLYHLDFGGYAALFFVGLIASCALVVPGISGSMILLIFGYYTPIVTLITELILFGTMPLESIFVIFVMLCGMIIGFFLISTLMKYLLRRYPQGTHYAILGFIIGSVAAVYVPVLRTSPHLASLWYWLAAALLLLIGIAASYAFLQLAKVRIK